MKIYKKGNYIYLVNASGDIKQDHANEVKITKTNVSNETYSIYSDDLGVNYVTFSELTQENGSPYASVSAWELWYSENTGFNPASGGSGAGTVINTVSNFSSLPDPTLVYDDFYWVSNTQGFRILGTYKANAESTSSGTFGSVISDIAPNSDGLVCAMGTLHDLDTRSGATYPFTADTLVDGDALWLDPNNAGYVTKTKPQAPNHIVFIGVVSICVLIVLLTIEVFVIDIAAAVPLNAAVDTLPITENVAEPLLA